MAVNNLLLSFFGQHAEFQDNNINKNPVLNEYIQAAFKPVLGQ